jgi:predicted transcriptional regulator
MSQVKENYGKLVNIRTKVSQLKEEVANLKQEVFGEATAEEDIAKKFFSQIAISTDQIKDTEKELQEKKTFLEQAKKEEKDALEMFLKSLTTMRFPLKLGPEGIEKKDNTITFLFSEELDKDLFEEIRRNLGKDCLTSSKIQIQEGKIIAKGFNDVSEAMKEVISHVESKIWKAASEMLGVESSISELRTRDEKIQKMLYVLYEAEGKSLSKKEMETRAKLKPGDLRGVLYIVLKRDPYIREAENGQYCLTEVGKRIMQRYKEKYGSPFDKEAESSKTLKNFVAQKQGDETIE